MVDAHVVVSDSDASAQELLHHEDVKVTKPVYRRKVPTGTPLPSAIGGVAGTEGGGFVKNRPICQNQRKTGQSFWL